MPVSFRITCSCGAAYTGIRGATHQVLSCQRCQRPVFVLPASPWMPGVQPVRATQVGSGVRRLWWPWFAAALALCMVGGIGGWLLVRRFASGPTDSTKNQAGGADCEVVLTKAQGLLGQGQFRRAQAELEDNEQRVAAAPAEVRRSWRQTLRQARLLADLSPEQAEEIVQHGAGVTADEWQADFKHRYENKSLVFDADFRRLPNGSIESKWPVPDNMRLVFDDIKLLQQLDLSEWRRVILGVRLASIRLEAPGPQWVVRFVNDQVVLLTDAGAAASLSPGLGAAEAQKHLALQRTWLAAMEK